MCCCPDATISNKNVWNQQSGQCRGKGRRHLGLMYPGEREGALPDYHGPLGTPPSLGISQRARLGWIGSTTCSRPLRQIRPQTVRQPMRAPAAAPGQGRTMMPRPPLCHCYKPAQQVPSKGLWRVSMTLMHHAVCATDVGNVFK